MAQLALAGIGARGTPLAPPDSIFDAIRFVDATVSANYENTCGRRWDY